jgi:hypothetical protein
MTAAINGKRRPPPNLSASPRFLLSWLLFKLEPELLFSPLPSHCKHMCSSNPLSPLPPPRFLAAVVSSSPPVKDKLRRPTFLLHWFARGSPSLCYRRFSSPAPVGAAPERTGAPPDPPPLPSFPAGTSLRFRARLLLLRTVSNKPRSISLHLVHFGALTNSPQRPHRPLPLPATDEARSPPLDPPVTFACASATKYTSSWTK